MELTAPTLVVQVEGSVTLPAGMTPQEAERLVAEADAQQKDNH